MDASRPPPAAAASPADGQADGQADGLAPAARVHAAVLARADALETRRRKNRECMRRSRQRQRDELADMRAAVARLETQYAALCVRAAASWDSEARSTRRRRVAAALELAARLGAENLLLRAGLQRHADWTQRVQRVADAAAEARGPEARGPEAVATALALGLRVLEPPDADALFGFSALDEAAAARAVVDNAAETHKVRAALAAAVEARDPRARRRHVLGWDVVQRVRGSLMEYSFSKTFASLDVRAVGQRMWANDMRADAFQRVKYDVRRLDVLQVLGPNAYVLGRDVRAPDRSTVFRSLFLRFRTQVARELPNGPHPPLRASGFVIGTHSLNRDWACASSPRHSARRASAEAAAPPPGVSAGETLEWADLALVTEFLTIEDPATGDTRHLIQWIGRTDYKSHADALRNAPDTLTVCLRTEMLLLRPALRVIGAGGGSGVDATATATAIAEETDAPCPSHRGDVTSRRRSGPERAGPIDGSDASGR